MQTRSMTCSPTARPALDRPHRPASRSSSRRSARRIGLHPLIAEDIIESNERAKVQLVGDVIHVVTFVLERDDEMHDRTRSTSSSAGGFLLSVHPGELGPDDGPPAQLGIGPLLERGLDFLLWALVDAIVDGYFPVFDQLGDEIDDVQDAVVASASPATLQHLFRLKRELITIRHVVAPEPRGVRQLTSREFELIGEAKVFYFRDVYDHLIRLNDELDTLPRAGRRRRSRSTSRRSTTTCRRS